VEPLPGLPLDYVAVKTYFNECLPANPANTSFVRKLVERLAEVTNVVLLSTGLVVDDHKEWRTNEHVHAIDHLIRPKDNLAVQTRIVSGARALVATYGGFTYLGPLLRVPTLSFYETEQTMPIHLEVIRRTMPNADYERVLTSDAAAVQRIVSRVRAAAAS
jgi:hypothetical protein